MELLTIKELEKKIKYKNTTIYKFIKFGMPVFRMGGKNLFELDSVMNWLREYSKKRG
jgi:phage terminase Nu1 subunit (DNA packaging protein)